MIRFTFTTAIIFSVLAACASTLPPVLEEPASKCDFKDADGSWWHGQECTDSAGGCCAKTEACVIRKQGPTCEAADKLDFIAAGPARARRFR